MISTAANANVTTNKSLAEASVSFPLIPRPRSFAQVSLDSGDSSVLVDGPAAALPASSNNQADGAAANRSAVTASPKDADAFLTAAHDGYLRKWSVEGRRLTAKIAVGETPAAALAGAAVAAAAPGIGAIEWTSKGSFVACGLATGNVVLVSPEGDMEVLSRWDLSLALLRLPVYLA